MFIHSICNANTKDSDSICSSRFGILDGSVLVHIGFSISYHYSNVLDARSVSVKAVKLFLLHNPQCPRCVSLATHVLVFKGKDCISYFIQVSKVIQIELADCCV